MDILGIGLPELGFILLITIIILGPKDMQKAGKTIGKWMRKIVLSPEWREIKNASRQMQQLPTQLMREASLEEFEEYKRELNITMPKDSPKRTNSIIDANSNPTYGAWSGIPAPKVAEEKNTIAQPRVSNSTKLNTCEEPDSVKSASTAKKYPPIEKKNKDA